MERVGAQENKLLNEEKYQVPNTPSKKWSCYPRYEYILSFIPVDAIKAFCCNTESDDASNDLQVMLRRNLLHIICESMHKYHLHDTKLSLNPIPSQISPMKCTSGMLSATLRNLCLNFSLSFASGSLRM